MLEGNNVHGFMAGPDEGRFPISRDFVMPKIPCGAKDCVANDGGGSCVMPSLIKINRKKKCKSYRKSTNEGKGGG